MAFSRSRRALHGALLALSGGAAALTGNHGLYATALLAALVAVWIVAFDSGDQTVPVAAQPPLPAAVEDRETRQRLTAYLDLSPAPLVALDDGRLRVVNRAARQLLGASDLVAEPPAVLVAALLNTRPGRTATIELEDVSGARSFALATGDLALSGQVMRIGALIDIDAELKAAEATALRELVQVLSHEIVNALTPIASLADTAAAMLADPVPDMPQIREAIETVARRAASLHRFGESYRSLARLPPPVPQRIVVTQLANDLAALFATRWPAIELQVLTADAPAQISVDPDQLTGALWAVLQNAAEALGDTPEPRIEFDIRQLVQRALIVIVDNGPGVAAADEVDIFRPFFTTKAEGTGVGLSLARQILRAHGGDLALASSHPGATIFEATIPIS